MTEEKTIEHLFDLCTGKSLDYYKDKFVYSSGIQKLDEYLSALGGVPAGGIVGIKSDDCAGMHMARLFINGHCASIYSNKIGERYEFLNKFGLAADKVDITPTMEGEGQLAVFRHIQANKLPYVVVEDPVNTKTDSARPGIRSLVAYYRRYALTINPLYVYLCPLKGKELSIGMVLELTPGIPSKDTKRYLVKCLRNPYMPEPPVDQFYGPQYPEITLKVETKLGVATASFS